MVSDLPSDPLEPIRRFSSRVNDYVKYRPTYPAGLVDVLVKHAGLTASTVVADIGAGTGISSRPLLAYGCAVYGVEPNPEMRGAAQAGVGDDYRATFRAIDGRAEATGLPTGSVDLVVCAQAFHWFDRTRAVAEFRRILRPSGNIAIIFNERKAEATPFLIGYEELLKRFGTDYKRVARGNQTIDEQQVFELFAAPVARYTMPNHQLLDWNGLRGRLMSASYTPLPGQAGHEDIIHGLRQLFERYQVGGVIEILYETEVFVISLQRPGSRTDVRSAEASTRDREYDTGKN